MQVTVKGVDVYYEIHGSGTPILMIHGWSPDHRLMTGCMEPLFDGLDDRWQRVYLDLPGMGRTKGAPWITGAGPMLEIVLGFIDAVIPGRRFLVAGESFGGYLARGLVQERPAEIDGVLLLCPLVAPYVVTEAGVDKGDVPEPQVLEREDALLGRLSESDRKQFEGITVILNERVWDRFRGEVLPGLELADLDFLENTLSRNVPFPFDVDRLDAPFARPTLILTGRQDWVVGYRDTWEFLENYPRASFVVLDKAGHNLQIEQDRLFGPLVLEWLDRVAAEASPGSATPAAEADRGAVR